MATWSIKSSGGDFTSLGAAVADAGVSNGDTLSVDEAFVCQSSALTITKALTIVASGSFGVVAPTQAEATSKARIVPSTGGLTLQASCTIEGLAIIRATGDTSDALNIDGNPFDVKRCVILASNLGIRIVSGAAGTVDNCAIICQDGIGICIVNQTGGAVVGYQNSFLVNGGSYTFPSLWNTSGTSLTLNASTSQSTGTNFSGCGGEDNVSQDATAPGSNTRKSISGVFKNTSAGSEDLNLNGLNGALLQGVADYSSTVADLATDLNGNSRPLATGFPIDPGCAQIANGPSILGYSSSGALSTSTSTTETVSLNAPSGTKLLVVCASGSDVISSATWNGVAMTAAAAEQNASGTRTRIFLLANPDTGTHDAIVTYTSCNKRWIAVYALAEANNSNPPALDVADGTTGSGSSISKSTTPSVANTGVLDILANSSSGANPTPNSPQVFKQKCTGPSFFEAATSCRLAPTATSTSEGWTEDTGYNISYSIVYLKSGVASAYLSPVLFFNRRLRHSNLRR